MIRVHNTTLNPSNLCLSWDRCDSFFFFFFYLDDNDSDGIYYLRCEKDRVATDVVYCLQREKDRAATKKTRTNFKKLV